MICASSGWEVLESGCERDKEKMVSSPKKGMALQCLIALGFCLPYALPPSPEPKHPPGIAEGNQGWAQNTNLISCNSYFLVSLQQN